MMIMIFMIIFNLDHLVQQLMRAQLSKSPPFVDIKQPYVGGYKL